MNIGVLGTGQVGQTIATKLVAEGHAVKLGSRDADNPNAKSWAQATGARASAGTFADAAGFGEMVFNCTMGAGSLDALGAAGAASLEGKVIVDLSNPLDFSAGMPPTLFTGNADSLGERIQKAFPGAKVVKTLNTVNAELMVNPGLVAGEHDVFVSGNDAGAKATVTKLLKETFGWKSVIDLGDITSARGTESYLALWIRLWGAVGTHQFNIKVVGPARSAPDVSRAP